MRLLKLSLISLICLFVFNSCINQSIMLKTEKDFVFDEPTDSIQKGYLIQPNDLFYFRLYANGGFKLVDMSNLGKMNQSQNINQRVSAYSYFIDADSTVKLPILGRVKLGGKTVREAELFLQNKYAFSFNNPFVQLFVNNRRVFVFPGSTGTAAVVQLQNNNTSLIEGLALAGGLSEFGKAQKIKLIRKTGDPNKPLVYEFDLSTIDGLKYGNILLQTEDIIYVEPRKRVAANVLKELSPYIGILTSIVLTITTLQALSLINK